MTEESRSLAMLQLSSYGYDLDGDRIRKGETTFGAVVSFKGRFYVRQSSGGLLWSGLNLGDFVRDFWFAKRVLP